MASFQHLRLLIGLPRFVPRIKRLIFLALQICAVMSLFYFPSLWTCPFSRSESNTSSLPLLRAVRSLSITLLQDSKMSFTLCSNVRNFFLSLAMPGPGQFPMFICRRIFFISLFRSNSLFILLFEATGPVSTGSDCLFSTNSTRICLFPSSSSVLSPSSSYSPDVDDHFSSSAPVANGLSLVRNRS